MSGRSRMCSSWVFFWYVSSMDLPPPAETLLLSPRGALAGAFFAAGAFLACRGVGMVGRGGGRRGDSQKNPPRGTTRGTLHAIHDAPVRRAHRMRVLVAATTHSIPFARASSPLAAPSRISKSIAPSESDGPRPQPPGLNPGPFTFPSIFISRGEKNTSPQTLPRCPVGRSALKVPMAHLRGGNRGRVLVELDDVRHGWRFKRRCLSVG